MSRQLKFTQYYFVCIQNTNSMVEYNMKKLKFNDINIAYNAKPIT